MIVNTIKAIAPKTSEQISRILYNAAQAGTLNKTFSRLCRQYPQQKAFIEAFCSNDPLSGMLANSPTTSNLWTLNSIVKIFNENQRFMKVG